MTLKKKKKTTSTSHKLTDPCCSCFISSNVLVILQAGLRIFSKHNSLLGIGPVFCRESVSVFVFLVFSSIIFVLWSDDRCRLEQNQSTFWSPSHYTVLRCWNVISETPSPSPHPTIKQTSLENNETGSAVTKQQIKRQYGPKVWVSLTIFISCYTGRWQITWESTGAIKLCVFCCFRL